MKSTIWKDDVELIGIAAIVASLVFVGIELQQSQSIARADRQFQQVEKVFGLTDLISAHSALIVKINRGNQLTDEEEVVATSLVRSIWTAYFFSWTQVSLVNADGGFTSIRALAIFLNDNPGLKKRYLVRTDQLDLALTQLRGEGFTGDGEAFHDTAAQNLSMLETAAH